MRSPRRLSRPTTSERRRPRREPSDRPVSFKGIWTRRPSARIAIATWRRLRPSNRPKDGLPNVPGRFGRSAQSTRRSMIMQPPAPHRTRVATFLHPSRSGAAAGRGPVDRPRTPRDRRSPDGLLLPATLLSRATLLPALPRLENQGRAGKRGKDQKDPEGLSLQHASHLINTSAGRRRA